MRRHFCTRTSPLLYAAALALAGIAGDHNLWGQSRPLIASPFEVGAGLHETRAQWQNSLGLPNAREVAPNERVVLPPPPTRSSFMATWPNVTGAKGTCWMSPRAAHSTVLWMDTTTSTLAALRDE